MKDQATRTRDKPGQIFTQGMSHCDYDVRAIPLSTNSCKCTARNERPTPLVPCVLQYLGDLPVAFTQTVGPNPERFLIYDNGPNINNRLLVFASKERLRHITSTDAVNTDGNFSMARKSSCIYVIRAVRCHSYHYCIIVSGCSRQVCRIRLRTQSANYCDCLRRCCTASYPCCLR